VTFQNTTVAVSGITFDSSCVPIKYRMTFNGPASLLSSTGEPISVTFQNLAMDVDESTGPALLSLSGAMSSTCFGGTVTVMTPVRINVPSGDICPIDGTIVLSPAAAQIFYRTDQSVDLDDNGDGTIDRTFANCLDPRLFDCTV
jgi:hypothetical protein